MANLAEQIIDQYLREAFTPEYTKLRKQMDAAWKEFERLEKEEDRLRATGKPKLGVHFTDKGPVPRDYAKWQSVKTKKEAAWQEFHRLNSQFQDMMGHDYDAP